MALLTLSLAQFRTAVTAQDMEPVLRGRALQIVDGQGRVRASINVLPARTQENGEGARRSRAPDWPSSGLEARKTPTCNWILGIRVTPVNHTLYPMWHPGKVVLESFQGLGRWGMEASLSCRGWMFQEVA